VKPGDAFVAAAAHAAPGADVRIVEPGGALVLDADGARVVPPA
jgi:hypothetical protein